MPASDKHEDYKGGIAAWRMVRDCVGGSSSVKAGRTLYLPKPNPDDTSRENSARYDDYVQRAHFINFTGSTLDGMLGMVFRKPMSVELQPELQYLIDDATGGGLTLEQATIRVVSEVLQAGRYGILVDYPEASPGLSKAQVESMQLRSNLLMYPAESVINWGTEKVGGVQKLSLVCLREDVKVYSEDGFSYVTKPYVRALRLIDGVYYQELYDDDDKLVEVVQPKQSNGAAWNEIPFIFAGSENNDQDVDKSPLYDIADTNISHYRNSAEFEDSCYLVGQPTPIITGLSQTWVDDNMKSGVQLGSRAVLPLPIGASAELLQAGDNLMPERGMKAKEEQLIKIGARLIMDNAGQETAEAARIRFAGQNSKLASVVNNVEQALNQAVEWAAMFVGSVGKNLIDINRDFYDAKVDPQMIMSQIQLYDRGVISKQDMRENLRAGGVIDEGRTDDEIDADLASEDPIGGQPIDMQGI